MSNKTISINPHLFSIGKNKTKKNAEKTNKINNKPFISPNILKNKLLKRIKEHKHKEIQGLENKMTTTNNTNGIGLQSYSDEFNDSINYLQTLSKQKKMDADKEKTILNQQKIRQELESKTLKNYGLTNDHFVNIQLPEDLQQPLITVNNERFIPNESSSSIHINKNDSIPYGVLKGGIKPTYRDWNKTQRNLYPVSNSNSSLIISQSNTNINAERENRLHQLREKLKQKQFQNVNHLDDVMMNANLIQKPKIENIIETQNTAFIEQSNTNTNTNTNKRIKRTIKRKYTLGKSKLKKSVSVLIKNRETRKKIISAQKEMKKKSINDIKISLREHNLIKIGSSAPNDILRKIYESAMLAGEITNTNSETFIHNLIKTDKIP